MAADPATLERIALAFAWVIDAKSPYTYEHSEGVSAIAARIGERLGFAAEPLARLRQMALLHDIGKLAVPNRILDKPGPLTDDEFAIVRTHPRHTYRHPQPRPDLRRAGRARRASHHERMDGHGYHRGIPAGTLSAAARVLAVADVTDALGSDRPYRKGMPPDAVAQVLRDMSGTALCPESVDAAIDVLQRRRARSPSTRSLFPSLDPPRSPRATASKTSGGRRPPARFVRRRARA